MKSMQGTVTGYPLTCRDKKGVKPCPFCGTKQHIEVENDTDDPDERMIHCCGMSYAGRIDIDSWNDRPLEDKLQRKIAKLQKLLVENNIT